MWRQVDSIFLIFGLVDYFVVSLLVVVHASVPPDDGLAFTEVFVVLGEAVGCGAHAEAALAADAGLIVEADGELVGRAAEWAGGEGRGGAAGGDVVGMRGVVVHARAIL